jgi:hypothetical protein
MAKKLGHSIYVAVRRWLVWAFRLRKRHPCALLRPGTPAGLVLGRFLLIAAGHRRAVSARAVAHFILRDEREDVSHGPALPGGGAGPL